MTDTQTASLPGLTSKAEDLPKLSVSNTDITMAGPVRNVTFSQQELFMLLVQDVCILFGLKLFLEAPTKASRPAHCLISQYNF